MLSYECMVTGTLFHTYSTHHPLYILASQKYHQPIEVSHQEAHTMVWHLWAQTSRSREGKQREMCKQWSFLWLTSAWSLLVVWQQRAHKRAVTGWDRSGVPQLSVVFLYGDSTLSQGQCDKTTCASSPDVFKEGRNHPHCSRESTEDLLAYFGNTPRSFLKVDLSICSPIPLWAQALSSGCPGALQSSLQGPWAEMWWVLPAKCRPAVGLGQACGISLWLTQTLLTFLEASAWPSHTLALLCPFRAAALSPEWWICVSASCWPFTSVWCRWLYFKIILRFKKKPTPGER